MCESIGKCILIAVNVVFLLLGAAMMAVGALLQWGGDLVTSAITPMLGTLAAGTQQGGATSESVTISDLKDLFGEYMTVLGSAGLIILIIGGVLFGISFCGICGVCCDSKILLAVYVICNIVILLVLLVFVILFFAKRPELENEGENQFKSVISTEYKGIYEKSGVSRIIDLLQARLECCGVTNYTDFYTAVQWNRTYEIDYNGNRRTVELATPVSCCKMNSTYSFTPMNINCTFDPTTSNSNFETGCYTKLWDLLNQYSLYVSYALLASCGLLLILIIIAIIMIKKSAKDD